MLIPSDHPSRTRRILACTLYVLALMSKQSGIVAPALILAIDFFTGKIKDPIWIDGPSGFWQCTAFDQDMNAYADIGQSEDQAAFDALMQCGGPDWQQRGCYIPPGYCQVR